MTKPSSYWYGMPHDYETSIHDWISFKVIGTTSSTSDTKNNQWKSTPLMACHVVSKLPIEMWMRNRWQHNDSY